MNSHLDFHSSSDGNVNTGDGITWGSSNLTKYLAVDSSAINKTYQFYGSGSHTAYLTGVTISCLDSSNNSLDSIKMEFTGNQNL